MPKVRIIDVTNRDGAQSARINLSKLQKTMINRYLNQMGIYQSEFGFPTTWHEVNYLKANLELARMKVLHPIILSGWIRAVPEDVEVAFSRVPEIEHLNISISTSEQMIQGKWQGKKQFRDVLKDMTEALDLARKKGIKTIGVNAEDASRTELVRLVEFATAAKEHGADRFRYCDTVGCDNPTRIAEKIKVIAHMVQIPIELHCHNDLGMAVANTVAGTIAAIEAKVDAYPNTTILGIGERAGNCDLFSLLLSFKYSSDLWSLINEKIDLSLAWKLGNYVARATGTEIPSHQPGIGQKAFEHASGIHADAIIKEMQDPRWKTYELYGFEELGRGEPEFVETGREILMGDFMGTKGFRHICEKYGIELPKDDKEVAKVWELARFANVHNHAILTADELRFIVAYPDIVWEIINVTRPPEL